MKLKLYRSPLNSLSADRLISDLKNRDKSDKHIIITPDKLSLYYEQRLFKLLNEESFFDVSTTTLSRFANSVVGKADNILSKQGGVLIVKKILMEYKKQLVSFGKSSDMIGFAGTLFDTICMFKSCNILPDQIEENSNEVLAKKLKDIAFVYEKYEEYLKTEYTDSFNRLSLCVAKLDKDKLNNTHFYFVGFDDFTKQGYLVIEKLIKCAKSVNIATTFARKTDKNNYNIYLNSIFLNVLDIGKLCGVNAEVIEVESALTREKMALCEQIFANKVVPYNRPAEYIKLLCYDKIDDEIKNTALQIKQSMMKGYRAGKFAVILSNFAGYKIQVIKYFDELEIPYFVDESKKLRDTLVARFVYNLISIINRPTKNNVFAFLKSPVMNVDEKDIFSYLSYVEKFDLVGKKLLEASDFAVKEDLRPLLDCFEKKEKGSARELLDNIFELLLKINFTERVQQLMQKYFNEQDLKNYRMTKQSYDKVMKIFDEIGVIGDYECAYADICKFFDMFTENSTITIPPVLADSVMITDLDCGVLSDVDCAFLLGAVDGSVPHYTTDTGIISDDEIAKMPVKNRLNPTINVINKRAKFKVFELLFVANKRLIISYPIKNGEGDQYPSMLVSSLQTFYRIDKISNASSKLDMLNNSFVNLDVENFKYNNLHKNIAIENYVNNLKVWDNYSTNKNYVKMLSVLDNVIGKNDYLENSSFKNNLKPISNNLFMSNEKVGISEIEKFNMCPYMHFVDYGLKLKPSEKSDISSLDIGDIIHTFVKTAVFNLEKEDSDYILQKILEDEKYKYLTDNRKNNFVIRSLFEETKRIFKVLKYQQSVSKFKTTLTEFPFNTKVMNLDGKDIFLTGVIDRVDEVQDGLRVVDYKTGKVEFKNYTDVFYGNKIQVIVYISILSDKKHLCPLGALYIPVSNAFARDNAEELYKMVGVVEESLDNLLNFDENISTPSHNSKVININTTKTGKIYTNNFYKNMCISGSDMKKLCDFAMQVVKNTITNISSGSIAVHPINEDICKFCSYKGLCNFSEVYGNKYRADKKIDSVNLLWEDENE